MTLRSKGYTDLSSDSDSVAAVDISGLASKLLNLRNRTYSWRAALIKCLGKLLVRGGPSINIARQLNPAVQDLYVPDLAVKIRSPRLMTI